jgi:hypothetical protein
MKHLWESKIGALRVEYLWKKGRWNSLKVLASNTPLHIKDGSEEEFITEHFWGYTKIHNEKTSEYGVEHPRWQVYTLQDYTVDVDFGSLYGSEFEFLEKEKPKSVFLAEGSEIVVKNGKKI